MKGQGALRETRRSLLAALAIMALGFPLLAVRVNTVQNVVEWRWALLAKAGWAAFCLSFIWRGLISWKERCGQAACAPSSVWQRFRARAKPLALVLIAFAPEIGEAAREKDSSDILAVLALLTLAVFLMSLGWDFMLAQRESGSLAERARAVVEDERFEKGGGAALLLAAALIPLVSSPYQTNILIDSLIFMMLGLGLNIVVGLAGLLDLGYVAFYAVGAYSYALLNLNYGLGFWAALPVAGGLAALFGILLGIPVLRLRGDYLAIVTLGFGEIIRLILENWSAFSKGPSGIANIPSPTFLGETLARNDALTFVYYIVLALTVFTVFVIRRLRDSRLGRSWLALREDEIACQAMGIDRMRTKLAAFAMGATWAGLAGAVFAAKTQYINPMSFTFWESVTILCIVVLGGQGSIAGVVAAAIAMRLMPEYLRDLKAYRMLFFGAALVLIMVFRPQGLLPSVRRAYRFKRAKPAGGA